MRKVNVKIQFIRDVLQHRRASDKETIDKLKLTTRTLQKDPDNEEAYTFEAESALYRNENKEIGIPSIHLEGALIKAGVQERIAGRGKKTYKDTMKAFVEVGEELAILDPQDWEIDRRWVKVQQSRIMRTRPKIPKGATTEFTLVIFDDTLSLEILQRILEYAGNYVGVGDYRPKFGLFEVLEFKEKKVK